MKILNILWHFSTGGIGKCFLIYDKLGEFDHSLNIKSVCILLDSSPCDIDSLIHQGVEIIHIKNQKDFSWISQLGEIANVFKPDKVFCHGFNGPIVAKISAFFYKSMRVPMVCTYHGLYNPPTKSKKLIAGFINRLQAWMYKKYAVTVILVAKYSGEYLLRHGVPEEKMTVVYNGIAAEEPSNNAVVLSHKGISIGVAGRLDAIKGLNYLMDAIPEIFKHTSVPFHVYIVGDGPEEMALKHQAIDLGIENYISFEGYQNNVPAWLKAWDIFCLPSLQENHSIALLEAMRAGKAIVCTKVGGNPETVENEKEAIMVPSCDSTALANTLARFIISEEMRQEFGKAARIRFEQCFSENEMKRELCNILKS